MEVHTLGMKKKSFLQCFIDDSLNVKDTKKKKKLKKEWNSRRGLTISIGQCCLTSGHYQKKWTDCYTSNDQINNIVPIYLVVSRPLSEAQLEFYYNVTVTGK